ncbi:class I SAM-dependent methyltransferase [Cellulomonas sp. zg-ZUI222]|uniref:class I SAM-dependent methyltransferase n=1 Tax=Cellulomonas wangleii TaxID=2816956 RepID=UPI001A94821C|nr:class I SAM-dependent methyltransferase [Cellulomonas wangleii]MBO0921920.1 class I SAM-dependent methyltransferase [Cellulomonas wangleii]
MPDYDARLVELYDIDNPDGPDHHYVRTLADEIGAQSILDVGCGTGLLTVSLVRPGRRVVGVDPSTAMLTYAARRAGGDAVTWALGDSQAIAGGPFDLAVMSGNVAQHIPDPAWERTLSDIRSALRDGGALVFESRNPRVRAWTTWAGAEPTTRSTDHGPLREWMEVDEFQPGRVLLTAYNQFADTGELVIEKVTLEFREREQIERQLASAGFEVTHVWGDWSRTPFTDDSPLMVVEARGN